MKQISSLDLYFLTKELQILENQRIDSFYLENDIFYIKIYIKNKGNKFLTFNIGKYLFLAENKLESSIPSSFISYLRKNLKNSFIREFKQIENERILKIKIEKKINENKFEFNYLYLELFAPGNIILTDNNNFIKNMLFRKKFKDRKIISKEIYQLPPKKDLSIFNLNEEKLNKELKNSDLNIVKFLAIKFGIGGKFAEEIILRSNIDKNLESNKINKTQFNLIFEETNKILNSKIEANLIRDSNNEIINFIPIDFISINKTKIKLNSFNEVILKYFSNLNQNKNIDLKEKEFQNKLKKLKNRLKKQELQKNKILTESEKFTAVGNKIYENYSKIEELLNIINKSAKEKGWNYTLKIINESKDERLKIIKKINYKNNEIILNFE